jgi:hypothetical protein
VRVYADSSFILRLITAEPGSPGAIAEYRRLNNPSIFYLSLHALEVRNAILQRACHERRSAGAEVRRGASKARDTALARLERFVARRALLDVEVEMDSVITRASRLSLAHTERLGTRAIDLMHVGAALILESEVFLTTDSRQGQLAKGEGLKVISTSVAD